LPAAVAEVEVEASAKYVGDDEDDAQGEGVASITLVEHYYALHIKKETAHEQE
jgi:hypothetical protein